MQKAETVLSILKQKSKQDESHRYDRIYRNLFNEDFFLRAYQKIHAKQGNMTPGTDGTTIDGFSRKQISQLIELLKWERYQPKPVRRTYIPKKNGKMRPLGIPAFADKLVQEVVRQILEAIYEPIFSDNSHGFRPNRSCHTALYQIKSTCRGTNWVIEGDITGCFDHIDHEILLKILLKKIDDGRFLELIRKFLKAGYLEFNQKYNSLSGTPQGGIISPILANIYLHEFDKFMEGISAEYTKGKQRRPYREYQILQYKRNRAKKKGNQEQADEYLRQMQNIPALDPMDKNYQRVKYVRYADDFVVCIVRTGGIAACLAYYDKLGPEFSEQIRSMLVFDALIYNEDRHFGNFGVLRDNHSGNIIAPAPIFDNGLSLFCYAGKEDYANLDEYAKTRSNPYNISYEEVCAEVMGPKQKEQLRRMIGFRFKRHESLGLPEEHLQAIEKHLESRVRKLLAIPTRHLKQEKAR